jgi:hypothetical protein
MSGIGASPPLGAAATNDEVCPLTDLAATTKQWPGWWRADIGVYGPAEASNRADSKSDPDYWALSSPPVSKNFVVNRRIFVGLCKTLTECRFCGFDEIRHAHRVTRW